MKILKCLLVIIGVLGLVGVRAVEGIFYDPFLNYFHEANKQMAFPEVEWGKLILNYIFRFVLNLFFSAVIIQFIFMNKRWTLQAVVMMTIVFLVFLPIYLYAISTQFEIGYQFSFYMRRFVIQPVILLLIIPMFYYRKKMQDENHLD